MHCSRVSNPSAAYVSTCTQQQRQKRKKESERKGSPVSFGSSSSSSSRATTSTSLSLSSRKRLLYLHEPKLERKIQMCIQKSLFSPSSSNVERLFKNRTQKRTAFSTSSRTSFDRNFSAFTFSGLSASSFVRSGLFSPLSLSSSSMSIVNTTSVLRVVCLLCVAFCLFFFFLKSCLSCVSFRVLKFRVFFGRQKKRHQLLDWFRVVIIENSHRYVLTKVADWKPFAIALQSSVSRRRRCLS